MVPRELPCPTCGTVLPLTGETVQISRFPRPGTRGRVAVGCPGCARRWSVEVDAVLFDDLVADGCDLAPDLGSRMRHPAGRGQPAPSPSAPPLTRDDLLDFHLLLQQDDWFDRLRELERTG